MASRRHPAAPRRPLLPAMLALAALAAGPPVSAADQWYFEPRASLEPFYDSNVGFRTDDLISSPGLNTRLDLRGGRRSETSDVLLTGSVVDRRYFDASSYDTTDFFVNVDGRRKYERDLLGLVARVDYDSTLTSELETTGRVQQNRRRQRLFLAPTWTRTLDERTSVQLFASAADVTYQDAGPTTGLVDYRTYNAGVLGTYLLSEITQGTARLVFDRYDAQDYLSTVDSIGVTVGVKHAFTERLTGRAEVGVRNSESEFLATDGGSASETTWGPLTDFGLTWRRETGQLDFVAGRSLTPSGSGELLDTTHVGVAVLENLSERWSVGGTLDAYRNRQDLEGQRGSGDRDYVAFQPKLSYRLAEWWRLDASYRYRWQKYDGSDTSADAHAVFLNLSYTWPREPLARWSELE